MRVSPNIRKASLMVCGFLLVSTLVYIGTAKASVFELNVDGEVLGLVKDKDSVEAVVSSLLAQESASRGLDLALKSVVKTEPVKTRDECLCDDEVRGALRATLQFTSQAALITVNGRSAVGLKSRAEAEAVLASIIGDFEEDIKKQSDASVKEIKIQENVEIVSVPLEPDEIKSVDDAKAILLRGTDELLTYAVKSGDSLWTIARANDLTVDALRTANPQVKNDRLSIDQKLVLTVSKPYISVVSVETMTEMVNIGFRTDARRDPDLYPWETVIKQAGVYGKKEVTYEITRQNGRETSRSIIAEKHISSPVTQIVAQGSKAVADLATGQYAWPMAVAGTITSRYGPRGGSMHHGVDIAAPTGTPVRAADAGTVTSAGYLGNYGNMVTIEHGGSNSAVTVYGHLSKILVKVGQTVEKGDTIGNVGSTGRSTGPHLHFEVKVKGATQNPLNYYPTTR